MIVDEIQVHRTTDGCELSARVQIESIARPAERVFISLAGMGPADITTQGDPFITAFLLPAMTLGEDLSIAAGVSPKLASNVDKLMDVYASWRPELEKIKLLAPQATPPPGGDRVGLMFSCGVDSLYSLLKNVSEEPAGRDVVTDLIYVHGFDIPHDNNALFERILQHAQRVAEQTGKNLVVARTNIRGFVNTLGSTRLYPGSELAGVAHALQPILRRCVIASSWAYEDLRPWGTHPLVDPLRSSETLEFVHDGCEARRIDKVVYISKSAIALQNLVVCRAEERREVNCGMCRKCRATKVLLEATGVGNECTTLPFAVDLMALRRTRITSTRGQTSAVAAALSSHGRPDIARALRTALALSKIQDSVLRIARRVPPGRRALKRMRDAMWKMDIVREGRQTLVGTVVEIEHLSASDLTAMEELFITYYDSTTENFARDLKRKTHSIVLRDKGTGQLRGFSTLLVLDMTVQGEDVVVVYSGDTVIDERFWGQKQLQRAFTRFTMSVKLKRPDRRTYWLLPSQAPKTYLLLANNFTRFYPRVGRKVPTFEREVMTTVASRMFGDRFDRERGIVELEAADGAVRPGVADLSAELLSNVHVRFFADVNPGHARGEELVCLGEVTLGFALKAMTKVWLRRIRKPTRPAQEPEGQSSASSAM